MLTTSPAQSPPSVPIADVKRLHITPLTAALLPKILGNHLPLAKDISFHQLANFPTRAYGFVTLPAPEAAMVKKKLHGTILRGEKVAIEDARPDARKERAEQERLEAVDAESDATTPGRSLRKRKRDDGVIAAAVELPADRKVKRGWTEPKDETEARKIKEKRDRKANKDEKKSKKTKAKTSTYTDQEECLFQAAIPEGKVKSDKTSKKDRKGSKKGKEIVTIHEFENNTKYPSYLRQNVMDKRKVQEYDEEKGWVDEDGNVVESAKKRTRPERRRTSKPVHQTEVKTNNTVAENADEETSSSGTSDEDEDVEDDSSESNSIANEMDVEVSQTVGETEAPTTDVAVSITEPSPITPHPLETLFKKPKPPAGEVAPKTVLKIDTSGFSFFADDDMEEDTEKPKIEKSLETPGLPGMKRRGLPNLSIPVTPYNPRDMHWRSQRSAAPTPDTAAPSKSTFGDPFGMLTGIRRERDEDIEEEADEDEDVMEGIEGTPSATPPIKSEGKDDDKESDFAKSFWENRGANTRAWKKRKREAAKEQRVRENRKRKA